MIQTAGEQDTAGSPGREGIRVSVRFGSGAIFNSGMDERAASEAATTAAQPPGLRVAPLLLLPGNTDGERWAAVGHVLITVTPGRVSVEATLVAAWAENGNVNEFTLIPAADSARRTEIESLAAHQLQERLELTDLSGEPVITAARLAKSLAEFSRNTVGSVREIRYALEACLAESSTDTKASEEYTDVIAALLQLNIICGRAADQAREAVREGLWVHTTDSEAYHAYRKLQDPALINQHSPATHETRPWMRVHDAAVRQCQEMCRQLEKETECIRMLLSAASSISGSREADAQARFNLLVALLSIGLGIPALFLTMYGANLLLPMNTWPKVGAFLPVGIALLGAGTAAIWFAPRGSKRRIWLLCGTSVLVVLVLMVAAAILAPVSLV
ncbi:hypothetical protein [Arthrobacter sp. 7Tela_A1]|uniref:hypothetical protein n=1 Tax=Arthrobacter sp. 7Tela_A1 TaxID=3093745 RepID=UPI003BB6BE1D